MELTCNVKNLKETKKLAKKFAKTLVGGDIVLLNGDLGAGKTTFVKWVAKALGVKDEVTSPTFTIMKEYQSKRFKIRHFDMYRLEGGDESTAFGFDEYILKKDYNVLTFIEWSERVAEILKDNYIIVEIKRIDEEKRSFTIKKG